MRWDEQYEEITSEGIPIGWIPKKRISKTTEEYYSSMCWEPK